MGIENFFNTLIKTKIYEKTYIDFNSINCDYLYIDFNSIIHLIVDDFEYDINYYLYSLIISEKDEYCEYIENNYSIKYENIDDFLNYFSQDNVDEFIKDKIYDFLKNLCYNMDSNKKLKQIFISFDGTPTFSKISEQRKKKYVNSILSEFKSDIYNKNKDKFDLNRIIFEEKKIRFGKNQANKYCGNWTGHVQDIYNNISSFHFKMEMHEMCPNLQEFIVSSAYEFGEGEKKITEHILQNKKHGNYYIFSPDSDTVLLSIIIGNKLKRLGIETNFNILKYDSLEGKIETISITEITNNLYNMVFSRLNSFRKHSHDKLSILDDIVALFTFFGNDFLPRIESINMKNGLEIICTTYAKNLSYTRSKYPYILFIENNITKININMLTEYITKLSDFEDKLLFDKYMALEFKNFNYLLNIFGVNEYTPFFIDKLNRYCHGFNKIIRYIKLNPDRGAEEIYKNIIEKFTDKNEWERLFKDIENKDNQNGNLTTLELLNIIIDCVKENKKYKLGLKLIRNSDNISERFHQNNIKEDLDHPKITISDYDVEIYKFDKKMDEYKNISLEINEKIGLVDMKYKDNEYKIHTDRNIIIKKDFFYSNIMKVNDIDKLIEEYLRGFCWVIDFYFNKTNRNININNISIWSYEYTHAPYFKDISKYLTLTHNIFGVFTKLFRSVSDINSDYYVSPSQYINTFEQYLYITPKHILKNNIPDIYREMLSDDIFIEIDTIYDKIKNGDTTLIESYDTKLISKSNIIGFIKTSYFDFMSKIISLRKINEIESII